MKANKGQEGDLSVDTSSYKMSAISITKKTNIKPHLTAFQDYLICLCIL